MQQKKKKREKRKGKRFHGEFKRRKRILPTIEIIIYKT